MKHCVYRQQTFKPSLFCILTPIGMPRSTSIVLETLYDKVVEGGFVVLDDYWRWPGCREAVTDYLKEHQIQGVILKQADLHGVFFQKPPRCRGETVDN